VQNYIADEELKLYAKERYYILHTINT